MRKLFTLKTFIFLALGIFFISLLLFLHQSSDGCVAGSDCPQPIKPELLWEPLSQQFITSISPY